MPSVEQEIRSFIVEHFLLGNEDSLKNDDSFLEKGTFDSTGILELVSFLEQKYHIELEPDELIPENLDSVNCLVQFLQRRVPALAAVAQVR
jgi:acyl carrier protein